MQNVPSIAICLLGIALIAACDRTEKTTAANGEEAGIWPELDLSLAEMTKFCEQESRKPPKKRENKLTARPDPPTKEIATKHWAGILRYLHPRDGMTSQEGCFVHVSAVSPDTAHDLASFEQELGLPNCEHRFEYPSTIYCLVADEDPSGLAMWSARFTTADHKLVQFGLATVGFSPARGEKLMPEHVVRPKVRPVRDAASDAFTPFITRVEVDEHGVTYGRIAPWFTELETPPVRERFQAEVESCEKPFSGRCTFSSPPAGPGELTQLIKRQRNDVGRAVPPSEADRERRATIAIDAAASTQWGDMAWVVRTATTAMPRVIFVADGPKNGSLPTFSHISPAAWENSATQQVDEVPEPADSPFVDPPTAKLAASEVVITVGDQSRSVQRAADGYDWAAIRAVLVELYPEQQTRPKLRVDAETDVTWEVVFRFVEAAAYADGENRLYDVVF